jgi:hypothetical protein
MRALFTQLSFLIGLVTALELHARQPDLPIAILLGIAAACTIYTALLLGDHAIHRYFEDKARTNASLTYLDATSDRANADRRSSHDETDESFDTHDAMAA